MKDMKDLVNKALSLGLGLAVTSKEQVEKLVDELVKRGEMSRAESSAYVEELMTKGGEARQKIEDIVRDRFRKMEREMPLVTRKDIEGLERRLEALERKVGGAQAGSAEEADADAPGSFGMESGAAGEEPGQRSEGPVNP